MTTLLDQIVTQIENRARLPLALWALRGQSILYIEDVPSDIEAATIELGKHKLKVIGGWGDELKERVSGQRIGVAIVDHVMPDGTSGFQFLHEIRGEIGQQIPVVGYSAVFQYHAQCRVAAKECGEDIAKYVRKPSKGDRLLKAVCLAFWASIKREFLRLLLEEIKANVSVLEDTQVMSRATGKVINIAGDVSVVKFRSKKQEVRLQFPVWRLREAGADELNSKVEHLVLKMGTQVISDLRSTDILRKPTRRALSPGKLTPKIEEEMRIAEEEAKEEEDREDKT